MTAGDLLRSKGWVAHLQGNGNHPLWSKNGCEPMPLGDALEMAHAAIAVDLPRLGNSELAEARLAELIAEGRKIIADEDIPASKVWNEEMHAAMIAVARWDEAHRRTLEATTTSGG